MEFIELMKTIRRHIILIVVLTVFSAVFSLVVVRGMTKIYSATTTVVVQAGGGGINPAASLFGFSSFLTGNMSAIFVEKLVKSDRIAKGVIDRLKLSENKDFAPGDLTAAQQLGVFHANTKVRSDAMVVEITFTSPDPELAAAVANEIARQVNLYIEGESRKDYEYFAREATVAEGRFEEINERIKDYEEQRGVVVMDQQLSSELGLLSSYQAQLLAKRSELKSLGALLENTTNINLWTGTRQRLESLKDEINILSRKVAEIDGSINLLPEVKREYADLLREKQNRLLQLGDLEKQRDISYYQIERTEQKAQILDRAQAPIAPSKPRADQIVPLVTATGFFLAFFIAVTLDSLKRTKEETA